MAETKVVYWEAYWVERMVKSKAVSREGPRVPLMADYLVDSSGEHSDLQTVESLAEWKGGPKALLTAETKAVC
jgi:hypothetical protein